MNRETDNKYHKMLNSGEIYDCMDEEFISYQHYLVQKLNDFNNTPETKDGLILREKMLKDMLGTYGENLYIIPPIRANCGLRHVHVGKNVVINFNANLVDDGDIFIGDYTMIGPNVTIATACHPISPKLRESGLQYNKPIHIGKNVWIGGAAVILPGVTIGDNSIIGAGSVVTKDIEPNCIVVGNPAKILRKITPDDDIYFDKGKKIPKEIVDKYLK